MTTKNIVHLLSLCVAFAGAAGLNCSAAEEGSAVVGVLSGKTGHVPASEPAVQRAIEVLIKHQSQHPDVKRIQTELNNPIGAHPLRSRERQLIIGEPGMVPM